MHTGIVYFRGNVCVCVGNLISLVVVEILLFKNKLDNDDVTFVNKAILYEVQ